MSQKFLAGAAVFCKVSPAGRMVVSGYTVDGQRVICRWEVKDGFHSDEFTEGEVKAWVETPAIAVGQLDIDMSKYNF